MPAGLGLLTISFALGQVGGPVLSGWLADLGQDVAVGLWCSPAMLGLAAALSLLQHPADDAEARSIFKRRQGG